MKFIILKSNLKEGLQTMERVVIEGGSLPILKNVLIKTTDGKITLSATNLELGVRKIIPGKITEPGSITVPFHTIASIVSNLDAERINFETEGGALVVKTDNYSAKIQGISEEEFPIIPSLPADSPYLEIKNEELKESLGEIVSAAQFSEIRPEISGILFDFQHATLKLAATDSFRLAEKTMYEKSYKGTFESGFKVIVPLRTVYEVIRTFGKDGAIRISLDPHQILFKSENQELISRIISGNYPDYDQIVPKENESEMILDRDQFQNAVRLVSSFSGKVNEIKIKGGEDGKVLEVYAAHQYLGENQYLIPMKLKGAPVKEMSFNWRYLLDGLKPMSGATFTLSVSGDSKPAVIKNPDENSYFYLLMPVKAA